MTKKITAQDVLKENQKMTWTKQEGKGSGWNNDNEASRPRGDEPIVFTFSDPLDLEICQAQADFQNKVADLEAEARKAKDEMNEKIDSIVDMK
jgi:hypothetical protein